MQLMLEQAGDHIDLVDIHWYVNNIANDFAAFMANSEPIEEKITAIAGMILLSG